VIAGRSHSVLRLRRRAGSLAWGRWALRRSPRGPERYRFRADTGHLRRQPESSTGQSSFVSRATRCPRRGAPPNYPRLLRASPCLRGLPAERPPAALSRRPGRLLESAYPRLPPLLACAMILSNEVSRARSPPSFAGGRTHRSPSPLQPSPRAPVVACLIARQISRRG
jgi:hypothetical protein